MNDARLVSPGRADDDAQYESAGNQQRAFAQHQREDPQRSTSQRDTNPDFAESLRHQERQHTVDADGR